MALNPMLVLHDSTTTLTEEMWHFFKSDLFSSEWRLVENLISYTPLQRECCTSTEVNKLLKKLVYKKNQLIMTSGSHIDTL